MTYRGIIVNPWSGQIIIRIGAAVLPTLGNAGGTEKFDYENMRFSIIGDNMHRKGEKEK